MGYRSWHMPFVGTLLLALFLAGFAHAEAGDKFGKRLALVIGNSEYRSVYPLPNAVNDSHAVAKVLNRLGFEVSSLDNAGQEEFRKAIDDFSRKAEGSDATVFYYSGHGFQLRGANYLVPTDAGLATP